ncbi:hypothetical protein ITI46_32620 [Streptomyces oryzae]|uniref:Ricin B lectin domain-containing protein n=1 Tax=Streptomyces oryzae TaxID=1434886 RepID=A0ABS3XLR5_9ACTN|nr:hypothetical protein [Streptomyces oryzae]MBO8196350.1 hypothetical protein [Streptomyces oryzae]
MSRTRGDIPEDTAETRARRGRRRLLVAGALFATLILPKVVGTPGYVDVSDGARAARPSAGGGSASAHPSPRPGDGSTASPAPSLPGPGPSSALPSPPAGSPAWPAPGGSGPVAGSGDDSLAGAFRSVRAGQCLTVHGNGSGWSRPAPVEATRVDCDDDRAYTRVTAVRRAGPGGETGRACPVGNGRAEWAHGDVTLCVTRQFRTGQCLLAEARGGEMRAALMSAPACSAEPRSGGGRYDRLLTITGVHEGRMPCREGDAGAHSRYWAWEVDGGERTLCTADAAE